MLLPVLWRGRVMRAFSVSAVLSVDAFHAVADRTLDNTTECLEELLADLADRGLDMDADVELSMGVLSAAFPTAGTFVLNKQAPNRQLWLSSPLSGPFHYDFHPDASAPGGLDGSWLCTKDNHELFNKLSQELSQVLPEKVAFRRDGTLGDQGS